MKFSIFSKKKNVRFDSTVQIIFWQITVWVGLNLVYSIIFPDKFAYYGFFQFEFNIYKFLLGFSLVSFLLLLSCTIKNDFYLLIWNIIFLYYLGGEIIYYQYNPGSSYFQLATIVLILIILTVASRVKFKFKRDNKFSENDKYLGYLSIILFLPFLRYIRHINLKNLLFVDVYETREVFSLIRNRLTSYINGPLSRVLLPILIIRNLEKKDFKRLILYVSMLIYLYLAGSLKSIFIGMISVIVFYNGNYLDKLMNFLKGIAFLTYGGLVTYFLFDNVFLVDWLIRRVFFVPPYLGNVFHSYFINNLTYLSHSPFGLGLTSDPYNGQLIGYIGRTLFGGGSPNVGIITEGIFSFGFYGIFFSAIVYSFIIFIFNSLDIESKYFGIVFVYIYYLNTSLLSTLLITHGLAFFIVIAYFFLERKD